jgi:hypothetical protein
VTAGHALTLRRNMFLVIRNVASTVFSCKQAVPAWSYSHSGTIAEVSAYSTV